VSYGVLGAVFTAAMLVYGLLSLPTGLILNRVSPLVIVRLVLVGGAIACVAIALAPNATVFAVALIGLGVACGPYHTAGLTLVSRVSGNDARSLGHHGMVGNLGLAIAPAFGALLAWSVSWRLPFAVAAAVGLGVAAASLRMRALHDPGLAAKTGGAERRGGVTERQAYDGATRAAESREGAVGSDLDDPRTADEAGCLQAPAAAHAGSTHVAALILVFSITIALGFIYRGFATFLPALAAARSDVLPSAAVLQGGILASIVYLAGFFGQWWGGHLGGGRRAETLYAVLMAATAALLACTFFAVDWWMLLALAATSFVHFTTQPMDNTFTGRYTSLSHRSVGYGLSFTLSFGVGSFAAWAGGLVADAAGGQLQYVWLLLAAVAVAAAAAAVALAVLARRIRAQAPSAPVL
jgi:MFS family permease